VESGQVGVKPSAHGFSGGWLSAAHSYGFAEQLSCSLHQRELQGAQRMSGSERLGPGESAHPIAIPVLGWGTGPSHLSLDHLVGAGAAASHAGGWLYAHFIARDRSALRGCVPPRP
jgi:hypothetical protein